MPRPAPGSLPGGPERTANRDVAVARPPLRLLALALALAVLGGGLAALATDLPWLAVTGWVLAGPATFAALAWYSGSDTRQRAASVYVAPVWLRSAYAATAVVALLAVVVTALRIAAWVGRL